MDFWGGGGGVGLTLALKGWQGFDFSGGFSSEGFMLVTCQPW